MSKLSKRQQKGAPIPMKPASLSLDGALEVFLKAQHAAGHSVETQKDYRYVVGPFLRYMKEAHQYTTIKQVTEADVTEWLSHLHSTVNKLGRPYSSRSIETYHRDVSVFFSWLVQHKHLTVNPMVQIAKPKVEKALIRVFLPEELARLDVACDRTTKGRSLTPDERKALAARDRAFLWLLLSTGVRISEACGLLFSDINWENNMIYVRGKGAKERKVPMGKVARQHLNTYIQYWRGDPEEHNEHVFLSAFGKPLSVHAAKNIFVRLKEVADITDKRVSAHTCRHWFAVNAIKNGMPTVVLKDILGHESWRMIEVYVRLAEQDNREIYDKFSPVDALDMHRAPKGKRKQLREWRNARKKGGNKGVTPN